MTQKLKRPEEYTIEEFSDALASTIESLLAPRNLVPAENRTAVLLGGQSGAGKSTLHRILRDEFEANVIVINGDEFRKSHPRFELLRAKYGDEWVGKCGPWSGKMTEALIDELSKLGYNLVVEGTLRTSEVPMRTAQLLRGRGYATSLALMAVKPEISLVSCQIRYEEMRIAGTTPRATDPAHHAKIVHDIVDNLDVLEKSGLFDTIRLYNRSEECLYPVEGKTAAQALRECLFGEWTPQERAHYRHLQARLDTLRKSA